MNKISSNVDFLTDSDLGSEGEPRGKEEYTGIKEQWVATLIIYTVIELLYYYI